MPFSTLASSTLTIHIVAATFVANAFANVVFILTAVNFNLVSASQVIRMTWEAETRVKFTAVRAKTTPTEALATKVAATM